MSQRTADLYLVDILDAAGAIARSLQGASFDEFVGPTEKRDAVLWNLMILGEAFNKASGGSHGRTAGCPLAADSRVSQSRHPRLLFAQMANRLAHRHHRSPPAARRR